MTKIDNHLNATINNINASILNLHAYIDNDKHDAQTIAFMHRQMVKQNNTIRQLEYELYLERKHKRND